MTASQALGFEPRFLGFWATRANLLRDPPKYYRVLPRTLQLSSNRPFLDRIWVVLDVVIANFLRNFVERATGIEPVSEAWEASVLPLY